MSSKNDWNRHIRLTSIEKRYYNWSKRRKHRDMLRISTQWSSLLYCRIRSPSSLHFKFIEKRDLRIDTWSNASWRISSHLQSYCFFDLCSLIITKTSRLYRILFTMSIKLNEKIFYLWEIEFNNYTLNFIS